MKKVLAFLMAMSMVASLAACSSDTTTDTSSDSDSSTSSTDTDSDDGVKEERTVTAMVMTSRYGTGLQEMIEKLEEEENIIIDVQAVVDDEMNSLLLMRINSGEAPDLIDYNQPAICGFLDPETYLVDLSDEEWVDRIISPELQYYTDGNIYGYCFVSIAGAQAMLYNEDVFANAGVTEEPTTYDEFIAVCEAIEDSGVDAVGMVMDSWCSQIWMTSGYGLAFGDDTEAETAANAILTNQADFLDYDEFVAVLDDFATVSQYFNDDWLVTSHDDMIVRLAEGEVGMYFHNVVTVGATLENSYPDANIGAFAYTGSYSVGDSITVAPGGVGFSISSSSENIDTCKEIFNLFASEDYADLYYTDSNSLFPALEGVDGGELATVATELYNEYAEKENGLISEFNTYVDAVSALTSDYLWIYYQEVAQGKYDGETLLTQYQADVEKYLTEIQADGWVD